MCCMVSLLAKNIFLQRFCFSRGQNTKLLLKSILELAILAQRQSHLSLVQI